MPGNVPVGFTQGATALQVDANGSIVFTGGGINLTSGTVTLPGNLARGYIPLVARAAKTTATASGVVTALTTGTQPSLKTFEVTSGALVYAWATANVNPLIFEPVRVPDDLSTAGPMRIHYTAENGSAATDDINFQVRVGTATANIGATAALSTTPVERSISIASGSVPSTGLINVTVFPGTHATGVVSLFAAGISYQKKTS